MLITVYKFIEEVISKSSLDFNEEEVVRLLLKKCLGID